VKVLLSSSDVRGPLCCFKRKEDAVMLSSPLSTEGSFCPFLFLF
jgi:hypothetical protein